MIHADHRRRNARRGRASCRLGLACATDRRTARPPGPREPAASESDPGLGPGAGVALSHTPRLTGSGWHASAPAAVAMVASPRVASTVPRPGAAPVRRGSSAACCCRAWPRLGLRPGTVTASRTPGSRRSLIMPVDQSHRIRSGGSDDCHAVTVTVEVELGFGTVATARRRQLVATVQRRGGSGWPGELEVTPLARQSNDSQPEAATQRRSPRLRRAGPGLGLMLRPGGRHDLSGSRQPGPADGHIPSRVTGPVTVGPSRSPGPGVGPPDSDGGTLGRPGARFERRRLA
jgi:hypothetical protein